MRALVAGTTCGVTDLVRRELGTGPVAVRAARQEVRQALDGVPADAVDTAVLLASELVTNATLHVGGPVVLVVRRRRESVRIEVHDRGSRLPAPRRALSRDRTSGRGLHLVDQLADRWGAQEQDGGKVVWCEVPLS